MESTSIRRRDVGDTDADRRVAAVRRFNRFYTRRIGALGEGHLSTPFSLTEARVMYELAHRDGPTATDVGRELGLDAGYLSRILRGFGARGLVEKRPSDADARRSVLALTPAGRAAFADLDARAADDVRAMLDGLSDERRRRLAEAMRAVEELLDPPADPDAPPYTLRPHRPGDMGWVTYRHGALYWREYGWNEEFEALVAEIVAEFIRGFDPARERCWMAERDGEIVGSVFLVRATDEVAKLRLLLVEPHARGLGLGRRLVDECVGFARQAGYRRITLWTNHPLVAARAIYQKAGFRLVAQAPHHSFGQDLVGETWELEV